MKHIPKFMFVQLLACQTIFATDHFISWANQIFTDRKIISTTIGNSLQESKIKCSTLCQRTAPCLSFAYNADTLECKLYDKDAMYLNDVNSVPENSWKYYMTVPLKGNTASKGNCTQYPGSNDRPCSLFCMKYVSYPSVVTIDTAEAECAAMNGALVRVDRELKEHCVKMLLASVTDGDVLIQGTKKDGVWRYDDGTGITYFNWNTAGGQPSNAEGEDYLGIRKSKNYLWHDSNQDQNNSLKASICERA